METEENVSFIRSPCNDDFLMNWELAQILTDIFSESKKTCLQRQPEYRGAIFPSIISFSLIQGIM